MGGNENEQRWLMTTSLFVLAVTAAGFVFYYARAVLIPFVLAIFIASVVGPLMDWQHRRLRLPRLASVFTTLLVVFIVLFAAGYFLVVSVQTVASKMEQYAGRLSQVADRAMEWFSAHGLDAAVISQMDDLTGHVPGLAAATFGTVMGLVSTISLVALFTVFLLMGRGHTPQPKLQVYQSIRAQVRRYIVIKLMLSAVTGVVVWVILKLLGLELAGLFGMLTFLLNLVPNIGSIIATALPVPVAWLQFDEPIMVLLVLVLPGAVQMVLGNFVEPKLMGDRLQLHPVVVLMSLLFWGLLWGYVGMVVAVPLTAIIRLICMEFESLRPFADLMIGKLPGVDDAESGRD